MALHGETIFVKSPVSEPAANENNNLDAGRRIRSKAVFQLGFWSAVLTCLFSTGWVVGMVIQTILSPPGDWTGTAGFVASFQPIQMLNFIPSLPLASAFLVLMVCVYFYAAEEKRIWGMLGLVFSLVYAVMATIDYLIQLLTVRVSLVQGETEGLGLFAHTNTHSIFWALAISYAYMSLALLFAAWVFGADRLEQRIRWLFVAAGVTAPLQFIGVLFELGLVFAILPTLAWILGVPVGSAFLAALFRREMIPPGRAGS